jgi:hypothetical protein
MKDIFKTLRSKANVIGVGYGYKYKNGQPTGEEGVIVNVSEKIPKQDLTLEDRIPDVIDGYLTDVVSSGIVRIFPLTGLYRPLIPGCSIGHKDITAGSLGGIVSLRNLPAILSNNHVLANSNAGLIGDRIDQPGPYDQKVLPEGNYRVGELLNYAPVKFAGDTVPGCEIASRFVKSVNFILKLLGRKTRLTIQEQEEMFNLVDAALATIDYGIQAVPELTISQIERAELGDAVYKYGRTTGFTSGVVSQVDLTISVQYGEGKIAIFEDQFASDTMTSEPGDSGSGVYENVDDERKILKGLLFSGSDTITVCNQADNVKAALGFGV